MKKLLLPFLTFVLLNTFVAAQVWSPKAAGLLPENFNVSDISIVNEQVIWAVAFDYHLLPGPVPAGFVPKLLLSVDGGETWAVKNIEEATGRVSIDIHAFDENTACITTNNLSGGLSGKGVFRTTDGGDTWTPVLNDPAGSMTLLFFDAQEGVCWRWGWGAKSVARTTDAGLSWTQVPANNIPTPQTTEGHTFSSASNAYGHFGDNIWFGTTKGRLLKTEDRGQSWTAMPTGLGAPSALYSMGFADEKTGVGVSWIESAASYEIVRTTDGGLSWENTGHFGFPEVDAIPCSKTFIAMKYWTDKSTALSTDAGLAWTEADSTIDAGAPVFLTPEYGWMVEAAQAGVGTGPALYKWVGSPLYGRAYVNPAATGANNGQGWANAYTDLHTALAAAGPADEIWVAEGLYKPDTAGGSPSATFLLNNNLTLYGGFSGTECYVSERDIALHPTVLSGDLNGDDLDSNFVQNRSDNAQTILTVSSNVTNAALIDGLTFANGHANGAGANESPAKSGGGLHASGVPRLSHCTFRQNYAAFQGGGAYLNYTGALELQVRNCSFLNNTAVRGGGLNVVNAHCRVSDCFFKNNLTPEHGGGMRYSTTLAHRSATVLDCDFEHNMSSFGGGLRLQALADSNSLSVSGCHFRENAAAPLQAGWGQGNGGLDITIFPGWKGNQASVRHCDFVQNKSSYSAAACGLGCAGIDGVFLLDSCTFLQNESAGDGTVGIWTNLGGNAVATVDQVYFEGNTAAYGGGLSTGGLAESKLDLILSNSFFKQNTAMEHGALEIIPLENSLFKATIDHCLFDGNKGTLRGGALGFLPNSNDFEVKITHCEVVDNEGPLGAAVDGYIYQTGLPYAENATIDIENTLFQHNSGDAVFALESVGGLNLLNCTVAQNQASGVRLSDSSTLTLQNTILYNPGYTEYEALSADVAVTSNGGNLTGDMSLDAQLTPTDKQNLDPLFVGPDDLRPAAGSPCVDAGNNDGVTAAFDLAGSPRIQGARVDIGAYESAFTALREIAVGAVEVSPNPASEVIRIQLPENGVKQLDVQVFDTRGSLLYQQLLLETQLLEVRDYTPGVYKLKVQTAGGVYVGSFVKL